MRRTFSLIVIAVLPLTACTTVYPNDEIAATASGLSAVQTTFEDYYNTLDLYAQQSYITTQIYRGDALDINVINANSGIYAQKDIAARLDALKTVGRYAQLLNDYSSGKSSTAVSTSLSSFSTSVFTLKGAIDGDASASAYQGPVGSLLQIVSKFVTDEALREAFKTNTGPATTQVQAILSLLKADATNVLVPTKIVGEAKQTDALIGYYNDHRATMSYADRQQVLAAITAAVQARSAASNGLNLTAVIDTASTAITKLQGKIDGTASEADVVAALEDFASRVEQAKQAVSDIKKARGA